MSDEVTEWQNLGSTPIRSDAPAGESMRYDEGFEKIQTEIVKMEHAAGKAVNWKEVITLGQEILQKKSKDMLVASYVCLGLYEERGYTGLQAGLSCIDAMVLTYWDSLYPEAKRMRGRINAVSWLSEKGGLSLSRKRPQSSEKALLENCVTLIEGLEKKLDEKIGKEAPSLRPLRQPIQDYLKDLAGSHSPLPQTQKPADAQPSGVQAPPVTVTEIQSLNDAKRVLREGATIIRRANNFAIKEDSTLVWPYRLNRAMAWQQLDVPPPETDGKTMIPAPSSQLMTSYQSFMDEGQWVDLVQQVESQLQATPFWLDLNRFSHRALDQLGEKYSKAKEAVGIETAGLIKRIPTLLDLQFEDGTPFADDETRRWIQSELKSSENGGQVSVQIQEASGEKGQPNRRPEALKLMKKGKYQEAIKIIEGEISSKSSHRNRFFNRLDLAKLCLDSGQPKAAVSQLEGLDHDIERFGLEEWEPSICIEVFQILWAALGRMAQESKQPSPDLTRRVDVIYQRLCRLNLAAALDLGKKKTSWFGR